jgi:uncharacterized membrane protein YphA (DoxX/SURF4 family)
MARPNSSAVTIAPIFLRIALGVIFVWAGLGKFFATGDVGPDEAARLANLGVLKPGAPATPPQLPPAPGTPIPGETPKGGAFAPSDGAIQLASFQPDNKNPATPAPSTPKTPSDPPKTPPATPPTTNTPPVTAPPAGTVTPAPATAADFPNGANTANVNRLALALYDASHPALGADGTVRPALWPPKLGQGRWPVYFAWAVAITEVAGGALVLIGLITRLASFGLFCVMAGAMWLTCFGPAWQSGTGYLGFLPNHSIWHGEIWMVYQYQFVLLCAAAALMFAGPGALSLDGLTRRPRVTKTVIATSSTPAL